MKSDRPKIAVPYQTFDIVVEAFNAAILIFIWVMFLNEYKDLPETVATHFNAAGEADAYGHKSWLWIIPVIASLTAAGLFVLNRFPHWHNYRVNINEDNALLHYRVNTRIVRTTNFFVLTLMAFALYMVIAHTYKKAVETAWHVPSILILTLAFTSAVIIYRIKSIKK
ncbi:DUF1648 domain-containing protein [Sungkyunkwania multivorans]|uniref:DUF1648 domain-containing protein n=1 Tax=Sungkyunkwania multivorans TaxID=1173618 RepID=A0ABW3CVI4_9FLAO